MKFSLIHPSRGRCQLAWKAFSEWMGKASTDNQFEYLLCLDDNEPQMDCYKKQFEHTHIKLITSQNRSLIDAVNEGAKRSTGDILIVVSDDFGCPDEWDKKIEKEFIEANVYKEYAAIHINDTITTREQGVMTLPILSRSAYEQIGHIYNPIYFSMFCDNELYSVCKLNGWLIHSDLVFEHRHFVNGKAQKDATYSRQNSHEAWKMGEKIYRQRKLHNFK